MSNIELHEMLLLFILLLLLTILIFSCISCTYSPSNFGLYGNYVDIYGNNQPINSLPIQFKALSAHAEYNPPCKDDIPISCSGMFLLNCNILDNSGNILTNLKNIVTQSISLGKYKGTIYDITLDNANSEQVQTQVNSLNGN